MRLRFSYIRLWNTTDPWTATDTSGSLSELRAYTGNNAANNMATIAGPRTVVHFVSSSCGRIAATRCCVYATPADATGHCALLRTTACESRVAAGVASDLGPGSCLPSPCAR